MRYVFQTSGGIGNQIQLVPAYLYYLEQNPKTDIIYVRLSEHDNEDKSAFFETLARSFGNYLYTVKRNKTLKFEPEVFGGVIACSRCYFKHNLPQILEQTYPHIGNEIDYNNRCMTPEDAVRIMTRKMPLDWMDIRVKAEKKKGGRPKRDGQYFDVEKFDVIICNGGLNNIVWAKKRYQRWNEVVEILKAQGYTVACVGNLDEYIQGCEDRTEASVLETMDMIANCDVFAVNDSGWGHFACAVGTKTVIAYTATNIIKNWNEIFHRRSVAVDPEHHCAPCQEGWSLHPRWLNCKDWKCTRYSPRRVAEHIERYLNEA